MSTALAALSPTVGIWSARPAHGAISPDAAKVSRKVADYFWRFLESETGQRQLAEPLGKLREVYNRCAGENWDGEGASPLTVAALEEAVRLLTLLPSHVPPPEPLPEPSGAFAFEWYRGRDRVYVLSVAGRKSIEFAGLLGAGNEIHGRVNFEDALPNRIQQDLASFLAAP